MGDREPTMRSREVGEGLRRAMVAAGFSGAEAARRLGWSQSWISRVLSGQRRASAVDVAIFLTTCGEHGPERDRLVALCEGQGVPGWLQEFDGRLPKQLVTLIDHEDKARRITDLEPTWVPGLLQTEDYARALMTEAAVLPAEKVPERVATRLARQELLGRGTGALFEFFVHETALRLPVGGTPVLSEQLHHLLRVSVRPVVYLESQTTALFLEQRAQVRAYRRIVAALTGTALDEGHSRDLIATLAEQLSADLEDRP